MRDKLLRALAGRTERVLEWQTALTSYKAVGPDSGGAGEWEKAVWLEETLRGLGVTNIEHIDSPDARVASGKRPNLVVRVPGKTGKTLWIMGHLDVVPPGDMELWQTDPWLVSRDRSDPDMIRGRGVEDNQQGIVSGALLAAELAEQGIVPDIGLAILCIADEETGNKHGVNYVLDKRPDLIPATDLVVVPDFGTADGAMIEIAEKGVLWVKVTVHGVQCHGAAPDEGKNTLLAAAEMILRIAEMEKKYDFVDPLFQPGRTTITPTRHEENVPNVNTIPGKDIFYIDCRILPHYTIEGVLEDIKKACRDVALKRDVRFETEVVNLEPLVTPTSPDSEIVVRLKKAVKQIYGIDCREGGASGWTVAGSLRALGVPAAVWARVIPNFHQPNEGSRLSHAVNDARVYASLLFERD